MPICAICRKDRKRDKLQEDRLVCKDTARCLRIAANQALTGPTRAQSEAKRLRREGV